MEGTVATYGRPESCLDEIKHCSRRATINFQHRLHENAQVGAIATISQHVNRAHNGHRPIHST